MTNFFTEAREPMSCWTHGMGAILFFVAGIVLIFHTAFKGNETAMLLAVVIFVISLVALYGASWIYHYMKADPERILFWRKLDHAMIFVLIAGTYTPMCLYFFPGGRGLVFCLAMWLLAVLGIALKICRFEVPRWVSTAMYLFMGWIVIFFCRPIIDQSWKAFWLLLLGGLFYSVGAIIYAIKRPNITPVLGFHEIFHLFVILGSLCHFILIWCLLS